MDRLAALSLIATTVHFINFGLKSASAYRKIYNSKSEATSRKARLAEDVLELEKLCNSLSIKSNAEFPLTDQQLLESTREIERLQTEAQGVAKELLRFLSSLKAERRGRRAALRAMLSSARNASKVDALQERLRKLQERLDSRVLTHLEAHFDVKTTADFIRLENLDHRQLEAMVTLSGEINRIQGSMTTEAKNSRQHLLNRLKSLLIDADNTRKRLEVEESLYFRGLRETYEITPEAHSGTFTWVFHRTGIDDSSKAERRGKDASLDPAMRDSNIKWDCFIDWLERGHGIYWIEGRPAAGKSVLMRYIFEHPRTRQALESWSKSPPILLLSVFFTNTRTQLQSSTIGCLRSLLWQALDLDITLWKTVSLSMANDGLSTSSSMVWTQEKLVSCLQAVFESGRWFFLLVDGLDECTTSLDDLLLLIINFSRLPRVKICVSSRPGTTFDQYLNSSPHLKLQDLTKHDIAEYVYDELTNNMLEPNGINELAAKITERADGDFHWVASKTHDIIESSMIRTRLEDMHYIVDEWLPELVQHHFQMLSMLSPQHKNEAALYFALSKRCRVIDDARHRFRPNSRFPVGTFPLTVFATAEAINLPDTAWYDDLVFRQPADWLSHFLADIEETERRIKNRCCGLLEIRVRKYVRLGIIADGSVASSIENYLNGDIRFIDHSVAERLESWTDAAFQQIYGFDSDKYILRGLRRLYFELHIGTSLLYSSADQRLDLYPRLPQLRDMMDILSCMLIGKSVGEGVELTSIVAQPLYSLKEQEYESFDRYKSKRAIFDIYGPLDSRCITFMEDVRVLQREPDLFSGSPSRVIYPLFAYGVICWPCLDLGSLSLTETDCTILLFFTMEHTIRHISYVARQAFGNTYPNDPYLRFFKQYHANVRSFVSQGADIRVDCKIHFPRTRSTNLWQTFIRENFDMIIFGDWHRFSEIPLEFFEEILQTCTSFISAGATMDEIVEMESHSRHGVYMQPYRECDIYYSCHISLLARQAVWLLVQRMPHSTILGSVNAMLTACALDEKPFISARLVEYRSRGERPQDFDHFLPSAEQGSTWVSLVGFEALT